MSIRGSLLFETPFHPPAPHSFSLFPRQVLTCGYGPHSGHGQEDDVLVLTPIQSLQHLVIEKVIIMTPSPGQNGRHFSDVVFKCIFINKKNCISIRISLKFVPTDPVDGKHWLRSWHQTGDKPLSDPMLTQFITDAYAALGKMS